MTCQTPKFPESDPQHPAHSNTPRSSVVVVGEHNWSSSGETTATKRIRISQVRTVLGI